jgi:RNA ligase (TIGR02306 family)
MERSLASIQTITNLIPIEGADNIECAQVLGWQCIVKRGDFKVGDWCVYIEIDALVPVCKVFDFLSKTGVKISEIDGVQYKGYRIRTIKLRGCLSQGLAMPINAFIDDLQFYKIDGATIGEDVSYLLGIVKYEPPIPISMQGEIEGKFPRLIPKTDLIRIQSAPDVLVRNKGKMFMVQEKVDGQSITCYLHDGEFRICSRNLELKDSDSDSRVLTVKRLLVKEALEKFSNDHKGNSYAFQGEFVGPGIQNNRLKLKSRTILFFDIFNITTQRYLNPENAFKIFKSLGLPTVPILYDMICLEDNVEALVNMADGDFTRTNDDGNQLINVHRDIMLEGHAWKALSEDIDRNLGRLVFKVINNGYLLKHKE